MRLVQSLCKRKKNSQQALDQLTDRPPISPYYPLIQFKSELKSIFNERHININDSNNNTLNEHKLSINSRI